MSYPWETNRNIARWIANRPHGEEGDQRLLRSLVLAANDAFNVLEAHRWIPKVRGEQLYFVSTLNEGDIAAADFIDVESPSDLSEAGEQLLQAFQSLLNLDKDPI